MSHNLRAVGYVRPLTALSALALLLVLGASARGGQGQGDEPPPAVRAADVVPANVRSGPGFAVADEVTLDGYLYAFTVTSDYGPFTALGISHIETRVSEIEALRALDEVSKSAVFLKSAGGAVVDIGKGAANAVVNPVDTAKGIGSGIKRFGVNLGRTTKRVVTTDEGADTGESSAESAANAVLGVSSAMRSWAEKVKADPYTTNLVLRDALKSIAQVDAAGSIVTKVVVPIPGVVGTAATVGDLVWSKDPEALRKFNEARFAGAKVPAEIVAAFARNGWYTLTLQTRMATALSQVPVPGMSGYLASATAAESEREALFFVESAELLQRHHAKTPVSRLLPDSRAVVALSGGGAVLLAPLDYVRSTDESMDVLEEIGGRARDELKASSLTLAITGKASAQGRADAKRLGWAIVENVPRH